jgi:hypothetical protein
MNLIDVTRDFHSEDACLAYLEHMRWPRGLACLKCGSVKVKQLEIKSGKRAKTRRVYQCLERECLHQFTATTGTIFHDTHLPLRKWFMAIALIVDAKKGMSALQLQRHLKPISYRTAWYLCHRIRKAMNENGFQLTGEVEVDETYVGPKSHRKGKPYSKRTKKDVVLGMVERGGRLRLLPVADNIRPVLQPAIEKNIAPDVTMIYTDGHPTYPFALRDQFPGRHSTIDHNKSYAIGHTHTNTIENAFSLFKRGLIGSYHHVSLKHLGKYCDEFSYRFNRRETFDMFAETLRHMVHTEGMKYSDLTF